MVQNEELSRLECELSVRPALIVAELNLIATIEDLHNGPDLPARQVMFRHVRKEGNDIE